MQTVSQNDAFPLPELLQDEKMITSSDPKKRVDLNSI
jgi:hypothetical protein